MDFLKKIAIASNGEKLKRDDKTIYYYLHDQTACYYCIVDASDSSKEALDKSKSDSLITNKQYDDRLLSYYITLAREKNKHVELLGYVNNSGIQSVLPLLYNITFDKTDGEGGTNVTIATLGEEMPKIDLPSRTGYNFQGYYDLEGKQYYSALGISSRNWDKESDATLYARWEEMVRYSIIFDMQGGGGAGATSGFGGLLPGVKDLSYYRVNPPTKEGYTFQGYYERPNGQGKQYYLSDGTSSETINIIKDTTLYAYWTQNQYTATLDKNGGTGGQDIVEVTVNTAIPTIIPPSNSGYAFQGYFDSAGTQYIKADGTSAKNWDKKSNATLYAHWEIIEYSVTLNFKGAIRYGRAGAENYDMELSGSTENVSIIIYYNKNGITKISKTQHEGPIVRDWWDRDKMYTIGWRFYEAYATSNGHPQDVDVQIPVCLKGIFAWGSYGKTTIDCENHSYDWKFTINIPRDGEPTLSSTDSGAHGAHEWWNSGEAYYYRIT